MVDNSKQNFQNLIDIIQSPKEELTMFLGAGISTAPPTRAPLANELKYYAISTLLSQAASIRYITDLFSFGHGKLQDALLSNPLEVILERIFEIVGEECLKVFKIVGGGQPNFNHYFLIYLLAQNLIKAIVTTNQDCYLENAYKQLKKKRKINTTIEFLVSAGNKYQLTQNRKRIFKLHGSINKPHTIRATLNQVGIGLEDSKSNVFEKLLETSFVYFTGYSGADIDIRDVILNSKRIKGLFWNVRNSAELSYLKQNLKGFLHTLSRRGVEVHFIVGDLNYIFICLAQNLKISIDETLPYLLTNHDAIAALGNTIVHNDDSVAVTLFQDAANLAEKQGDLFRAASPLVGIVDIRRAKGDYLGALKINEEVQKFGEKLLPSQKGYQLLCNAAYARSVNSIMLCKYDEAISNARTMIQNYKKLVNKSKKWYGFAAAFRNIAISHRDLGNYKKALIYDKHAQKIFRKYGYLQPESWAWRSIVKTLLLINPTQSQGLFIEIDRIHSIAQDKHEINYGKLTQIEILLALDKLQDVNKLLNDLESFGVSDNDEYMLMRVKLYRGEALRRANKYDVAQKNFQIAEKMARSMNLLKVENEAKLGRLENQRLAKDSSLQERHYVELQHEFTKLKIPWGTIHSIIGQALFLLAQNKTRRFKVLIDQAYSLAQSKQFFYELRQIEKIQSDLTPEEIHILSYP